MMRPDAWLTDPFGAGLGRWGGAPSGAAAPWYQPILDLLTQGGATGYLWVHDEGISTGVGLPVASWLDVTGTAAWEQTGVSSLSPLRQADALAWDGIDDRMTAAAGFDTALAGSTWTFATGLTANVASASRAIWATTDGTTTHRYNAISNGDLGGSAGTGVSIFGAATITPPEGVWFVRDGTNYLRRIGATDSSGSWASSPVGLRLLTLGARRTSTTGVFFSGAMSWALLSTRALSAGELDTISTILAAQGYPT